MTIDEIANDILKEEENQLARAFTMVIGSLLLSKGIQPIINKSIEEWNENDDLNKYIIRKKYNATFDIDTTEHDKQIRADERKKFAEWLSEVTTFDCGYCQLHHDCYEEKYKGCVARLIEMYEKEQK